MALQTRAWRRRIERTVMMALVVGSAAAVAIPAAQSVHARERSSDVATPTPMVGMGNMPGMTMVTPTPDPNMGGMPGTGGAVDDGSDMHMVMTPITGTPTAADQAKVASILAQTRAATSQYQDITLALADGYTHATHFTPYAHYTNYGNAFLAQHGTFDPTRPTSLLYAIVNGVPTLAGVMYTAPIGDTAAQLAQILPSTIVSWHQHIDICLGSPLAQTPAACAAAGGHWAPKTQWMAHAWIYLSNPDGTFAIKNPALPWPRRHR